MGIQDRDWYREEARRKRVLDEIEESSSRGEPEDSGDSLDFGPVWEVTARLLVLAVLVASAWFAFKYCF